MRVSTLLMTAVAALFVLPLATQAAHHEGEEKAAESEGAPAGLAPWDQAAVVDLVGRIGKHAEEMRQALRKQAGAESIASGQNRAAWDLNEGLRRLRAQCNSLRGRVEEGEGREDTMGSFQQIDQMARDAAERLRRMFLTQANIDRVKVGSDLLDQLRLYYVGNVDSRPALVGPKRSDNPGLNPQAEE